jgi:dethiobiotin synthetase
MSRVRGIFVTGTDTGVGKTVVTGGLVRTLRQAEIDAVPMKPVQTGCALGLCGLTAPDLELACRIAGIVPSPGEERLMCPYRFAEPCSPHLAARLAGSRIESGEIIAAFETLAAHHELIVVEGAGGLLVPLDGDELMLDLMVALALPVVVVARPGLGTINHTLLTLRELRRAGLPVLGVVFNDAAGSPEGAIERDNVEVIDRLGKVPLLGRIPFIRSLTGRGTLQPGDAQSIVDALPAGAALLDLVDAARKIHPSDSGQADGGAPAG